MSKKTDQTLQKCEDLIERLQELKKALSPGVINKPSNRTPANALGVGWSQDPGTGAFHHSTHGVISTSPHTEGGFQIRHGGDMIGHVNDISQAGAKIKQYVGNLGRNATNMHNRPSPYLPPQTKMGKPGMVKDEDGEDLEKSNYGPKGAGQYGVANNVKRKMRNTGDETGIGSNVNTKAYSTKPGQLSAKAQAAAEATKAKKLSGPVKQYTPAQIAAINESRKLKKNAEDNAWVQHDSVPNADEELTKIQGNNPVEVAENMMANQLASMMTNKAMLRPDHRQPSSEDMIMAGERMGLGANPELIKAEEQKWGGAINNWLIEASKPISQRFASEEEEIEYWRSIKVSGDGGGSDSGY